MPKKEKLFQKFIALPSPVDFSWENYITMMKHFNFTATCTGGSHYTFEHVSGFRFTASKTHPSGVLKIYQFKHAKLALKETGEWNSNDE